MKAWIYQDAHQVQKVGAERASWYVGWLDPEGKRRCKSCGAGKRGMWGAEKLRKRIEAELLTGTYQRDRERKTWKAFRQEYEAKILPGLSFRSREELLAVFKHFERIIGPKKISTITTRTVDEYVSFRRSERGKYKGESVSPATINKELRQLRAAFRRAARWGYLGAAPHFDLVKEPKKLVTYVTPEHFASIYRACNVARLPADLPYPAADWWRGLLVMAYMTGWRISELLAVRREDLDLDAGTALTRAEDNKGGRDETVNLHPVVIDHLRKLASFDPAVFPWQYNKTTLYGQFAKIQHRAGIKLVCTRSHQHSRFCHCYGFHDFRRAFATLNAERLSPVALQTMMRHKSFSTTLGYIEKARQLNQAIAALHVPEVLKVASSG